MKCTGCGKPFEADQKKVVRGERTFHEWCDRKWRYDSYNWLKENVPGLGQAKLHVEPKGLLRDPNMPNGTDPFIRKWQDGDDAA